MGAWMRNCRRVFTARSYRAAGPAANYLRAISIARIPPTAAPTATILAVRRLAGRLSVGVDRVDRVEACDISLVVGDRVRVPRGFADSGVSPPEVATRRGLT